MWVVRSRWSDNVVKCRDGRLWQMAGEPPVAPPAATRQLFSVLLAAAWLMSSAFDTKGALAGANKISLGKYENSVCHVASTVAVKIDYR
eukprot:COSAG01_NODE_6980_length_3406_cov_32.821288_2_plen_89_part_00